MSEETARDLIDAIQELTEYVGWLCELVAEANAPEVAFPDYPERADG